MSNQRQVSLLLLLCLSIVFSLVADDSFPPVPDGILPVSSYLYDSYQATHYPQSESIVIVKQRFTKVCQALTQDPPTYISYFPALFEVYTQKDIPKDYKHVLLQELQSCGRLLSGF